MRKHVLLLTTTAAILACGADPGIAQQGVMGPDIQQSPTTQPSPGDHGMMGHGMMGDHPGMMGMMGHGMLGRDRSPPPPMPRMLADDPNLWRQRGEEMRTLAETIKDRPTRAASRKLDLDQSKSPDFYA